MTTIYGALDLRPVRIGFLVNPGSMKDVRRAMRACAGLWGGIYNPIVPVAKSVPGIWRSKWNSGREMTDAFLDFFEPDVYVEARSGLGLLAGVKDFEVSVLQPGVVPIGSFEEQPKEGYERQPFGLSMACVYEQMFQDELRFEVKGGHRIAEVGAVTLRDEGFVDATCGRFSSSPLGKRTASAFREFASPTPISGATKQLVASFRSAYRFPLHLTAQSLTREFAGWESDPIFFVVDPESPHDLIDLWNLRLIRRSVTPVNIRWARESGAYLRQQIRANHAFSNRALKAGSMRSKIMFADSVAEGQAEEFIAMARLSSLPRNSWSTAKGYRAISSPDFREDRRIRRSRFISRSQRVELALREDARSKSVSFAPLIPKFAPEFYENRCSWVNVFRFRQQWPNRNLALNLPRDFHPKDTAHLHVGAGLLASREGLVLPQAHRMDSDLLELMTGQKAISAWLKQHGVESRVSEAGRIAEQLVEAASKSIGTKLLADRPTILLLDKMAKSKRTTAAGNSEEYPDRTASVSDWAAIISRRQQEVFSRRISLDHFIESGALRLGMTVECSSCTYSNWYSVDDLASTLKCERCRREFPFPQGSVKPTQTPWRYRVVGPFSTPNYAEGGYATALALRTFSDTLATGSSDTIQACGLLLRARDRPDEEFDVDFVLWYQPSGIADVELETLTVFGEAKSFGAKCFHQKDIDRMRWVAESFPGSFITFATLKEELADEEIALIRGLAEWGQEGLPDGRPRAPVIVLTGTELFSPWLVADAWKKAGGKHGAAASSYGAHRLDNLWMLSELTQSLYLGLERRPQPRTKGSTSRRPGRKVPRKA